ncbi:hypothetical protein [Demequina maris]|uniref:hypothetical protein n=1 Tax=Demequina maris TaxID=1638982 RepID=UPI000781044B|nr:hypothetical protein [Demequina maris]
MDADRAVEERARRRVAALDNVDVPSVRDLRDFEVQVLVRRGRRVVRRVMREAGLLRPWWERSPLLVLVVPLTLAYAAVFADAMVLFIGGVLLAWGLAAEPRVNRAEGRELARLLRIYRNAVANALDARADERARREQGPGTYGLST